MDVAVAKPGNVSWACEGHGMRAHMFIDSAQACVDAVCSPGMRVGERIERAVQASFHAVGCNTNLGIILLCAPLAAALERLPNAPQASRALAIAQWKTALAEVLGELDVADARATYRGIARANPGGIGEAPAQTVHAEPTVSLREAMQMAADRDSIARQYACGFVDLYDDLLPLFEQRLVCTRMPEAAALAVYLHALATWPDSHIVRKHDLALAQTVTIAAATMRNDCHGDVTALSQWDRELKQAKVNPGTSADLTVATLFMAACLSQDLPALAPAKDRP
jgi:triphosphoribosyl-dephospho-CoA synthase